MSDNNVSNESLDKLATKIKQVSRTLLEEAGITGFELNEVTFKQSSKEFADGGLSCTVSGFPPVITCTGGIHL